MTTLPGRVAARLQGLAAREDVAQNLTDQERLPFSAAHAIIAALSVQICAGGMKTKPGAASQRCQHSKDMFVCGHATRNDQGWNHPGTRKMVGKNAAIAWSVRSARQSAIACCRLAANHSAGRFRVHQLDQTVEQRRFGGNEK